MPLDPRHRSHTLIDGPGRAPARSMLHAVGFDPEDLRRPLVMVAHSWIGTMPCNYTHRTLAQDVMRGVRAAGGTPMEVNTIAISDGVTMGTEGMKASLVSRELITDSIELAGMAYAFDAMVVIVGCDKTIPAGAMAAARLNIPSVILYSGSIAPGRLDGRDLTIQDVFEGVGRHAAGEISEEELTRIEHAACPAAGACGAQYTANTMATVLEFVGLAVMGSGTVGATDPRKDEVGYRAGELVMDVLARGVLPRDLITREALENGIACAAATGGSTNVVLHLLALAAEAGIELHIDDFDRISRADTTDRGPPAGWALCCLGLGSRRRDPAVGAAAGSGWQAARRRDDADGQNDRRGGGGGRGNPGASGHPADRSGAEGDRRARHPQGEPGARGMRDQGRRARAIDPPRTGRVSSTERKTRWRS